MVREKKTYVLGSKANQSQSCKKIDQRALTEVWGWKLAIKDQTLVNWCYVDSQNT